MSNGYEKLIRKYEQYKKDLPDILEDKILDETAAELERKVRKRIFTDGLDSDGNIIAQSYSTKPTIVKQDVFIKPSAFKGTKTMKLEYGYKELRDIQGLKTDKVNLDYSGDLKRSLRVARSEKSVVIGINEKRNLDKVQNLEKKYQTKIFAFSKKEIQDHIQNIIKKLRIVQRDYFYGG
ncbi:hypothetical protein [Chryseobacterium sp. 8AT]|uniref:hypothetical protein n=1 Tax=Chryseobacterium sp. 8AT TaxID=2653134 RepID=UPI0012F0B328|nr:hypothetical protein [Chryseobacterium sp. 8AT]VXB02775.1 conserved hypothetical protein [Chryseobacterium sp. 8AT]